MQLMYTLFVLLQPTQRRRDHDVFKVLLTAIGCSHTDWTRSARLGFHRNHDSLELKVRLGKRKSRHSGKNLLVVRWYEAVVYRN